jgi:SH3 domain
MSNEIRTPVRVITPHARDHIHNISFRAGDDLAVGHRNQQYPAYVWCATEDGQHGWVPERFIEITGDAEAVALCDYSAAHLTVVKDEVLDVLDEVGGWLLCRNAAGSEGWVPVWSVEEASQP